MNWSMNMPQKGPNGRHKIIPIPNIALSSLARLRLLNVLTVRLRRLNPHRLDIIFDLELE